VFQTAVNPVDVAESEPLKNRTNKYSSVLEIGGGAILPENTPINGELNEFPS